MIRALALLALLACLASPFLYFYGVLSPPGYKTALLAASVAWFVFATLWATRRAGGR